MSSLARRTLRTTAAAAGIAAIGAGLAAPAFAAPERPAAPGTDEAGSRAAAPGAGMLSLPADRSDSNVPKLVTFEMPTITTAGPAHPSAAEVPAASMPAAAPARPSADPLPTRPGTAGTTSDKGGNHVNTPASDLAPRQNDVGALASMDTAKTMAGMAQKATSDDSMLLGRTLR